MNTVFFDLRVTALSPLVHSEGNFGNISTFRRQKYVMSDGQVVQIPIISGNAARNQLRGRIMWHMISTCGISEIPKAMINLLFSGGVLSSSSDSIDVAGYREMLEIVPALGLFGGGVGNALIPGCLRVGAMVPICMETTQMSEFVPDCVVPERYHAPAVAAYMDTFQGTRKELFGDKRYTGLLPPKEQKSSEERLLKGKAASEQGEHPDKADSQQMIYHIECMAAGTPLHWRVGIQDATDLEYECLLTGLALMAQNGSVGGKGAVGFGRIRIDAYGMTLPQPQIQTSNLPAFRVGEAYARHLEAKKEDIAAWIKKGGGK